MEIRFTIDTKYYMISESINEVNSKYALKISGAVIYNYRKSWHLFLAR